MKTITNPELFFKLPQYMLNMELSNNERMVYAVINDRNNLSQSNNLTHNGRICVYYSRQEIAEDVGLCTKTVTKAMKKLKMCGLIDEDRQGQGKANIIYIIPPKALENIKNGKNSIPRTETNSDLETKKIPTNKTKLNKTKLNNNNNNKVTNNDDIYIPSNNHQTSNNLDLNNIIENENIEKFKVKWQEVKNQPITLSKTELKVLNKLIANYGIDKVLTAVNNISLSDYLMKNCTFYDFTSNFIKILNNKYINKPKNSPKTAPNGEVGEHPTPIHTTEDRGEFVGEITKKMLEIIKNKEEISNISYNTWFSNLKFMGYTKVVEIVTPNEMTREIIGTRYMALIRSVLRDNNVTLPITLAEI